jgi:hypothetical protein
MEDIPQNELMERRSHIMTRLAVEATTRLRACHMATAFTVTLGTLHAGATGAHAKTLRVDDDGVQDRKAQYRSIQAAVDAAKPGDVIKVAPGTYLGTPEKYNSALSIRQQRLKIKGAQSGNRNSARMTSTPDPTKESIIVVSPGKASAVSIVADKVILDGFFVKGRIVAVALSRPLSGVRIQNNVVGIVDDSTDDSLIGITLQELTSSTISNNIIFGLSNPRKGGIGINSHWHLSDVSIVNNRCYNLAMPILMTGNTPPTSPQISTDTPAKKAPHAVNIKIP